MLAAGEFQIVQRDKNKEFDRRFNLRHEVKKEILRSLIAADCIAIEPNDNQSYPEAEVYAFKKLYRTSVYGEETDISLYIKTYLRETETRDLVIVISFHEEGMF